MPPECVAPALFYEPEARATTGGQRQAGNGQRIELNFRRGWMAAFTAELASRRSTPMSVMPALHAHVSDIGAGQWSGFRSISRRTLMPRVSKSNGFVSISMPELRKS
jgi:hypothetical protein